MAENTSLQGKDKSSYVRLQKGHSLILHILLCFTGIGIFTIPYISISKNHYWHA
jgi:hypothetical protein